MKKIIIITAIVIVCIFGAYLYLTDCGNNGNPRFMHHRYNKVITEPLAKIGFSDAQYKMGLFWYYGGGESEPTQTEIENAVYWWEKASANGNEKAIQELEKAKELLARVTKTVDTEYEQYVKPLIQKAVISNDREGARENSLSNELAHIKSQVHDYPPKAYLLDVPSSIQKRIKELVGDNKWIDESDLISPIESVNDDILTTSGIANSYINRHGKFRGFNIYFNLKSNNISVIIIGDSSNIYCYSENGEVGEEFSNWFNKGANIQTLKLSEAPDRYGLYLYQP